jgi:hypothetical protein
VLIAIEGAGKRMLTIDDGQGCPHSAPDALKQF